MSLTKPSYWASHFFWSYLRYALIGWTLIKLIGHDLKRHTPVYIRSHSWQCISEQDAYVEMEEASRRTTITATHHWSGLCGSQTETSPQWKTGKPTWSLQKRTFWLRETRFYGLMKSRWNYLASILRVMSGGKQAPPIICPVPSQRWSTVVVAASCFGDGFQRQGSPSNRTMTLSTQSRQRRSGLGTTPCMSLSDSARALI